MSNVKFVVLTLPFLWLRSGRGGNSLCSGTRAVPALSAENQAEAEGRFRQAIDVARQQCAKSLELRAAMSLSRLRQKQGRKEEAREMLAEIYG